MRADSGYYDQKLVQICAARGVEFFIVAKKHANVSEGREELVQRQARDSVDGISP